MEKKREKKQFAMRFAAAAAAVVLVLGGATVSMMNGWGLPYAQKNDAQTAKNYAAARNTNGGAALYSMKAAGSYDAAEEAAPMLMTTSTGDAAQVQTKIIRTIDFSVKTRSFDEDYEKIQQLAKDAGGRVESLSVSGDVMNGETRYAHFTLRIPSERLDAFLGDAKAVGAATAYSEYAQDVSEDYYDTQARLATQQAKMERLNELLLQAENMSDLIEIENAISDTQYQIDRYMGQLNNFDSRIDYSYVYVSMRELSDADAVELPDVTLGERIANAVTMSLRGLKEFAEAAAVFVIAALPWCAVLAVIVIAVKAVRRAKKK